MVLVNYAEFAAEAARGLVLPTLFSYSELLGGDLVFMGMLTSMFAAGRFFSSTFFGWLCDRVSFKVLYHICALIAITGNVMYILPYAPGLRSKTLLAVSRFTAGLGGGNRSVCRANIAALTRVDQRLEYFTIFATVVFLAYALTPGVGGVFGDVDVQLGTEYINFNRFTAPGFVLIGLNVLTMVLNAIIYDPAITREDAPRPAPPKEGVKQPDAAAEQKPDEVPISERMVTIGMLVFIFLNITARGILSIFETVNIPLYFMTLAPGTKDVHAALEASEASPSKPGDTNQASAFFFYVGLLGLLSYLSVKMLSKRVSDISFLIFGFLMLLFGNVILFVLSLVYDDTVALPFGWFLVAQILVWSIGCPLTSAVVVSAFSKVLGTRPQGTLMGIFGSSASIARIVLPLLPGILPSWEALFLVNMSLCAASILVLVCVSPSPIVGHRYDALPASVRVARVSGDALQAAFRGCCFNPLTNLLLVCDPVACCVKTFTILPPSHPHGSMRFEFRGKIGDKGNVTGRFMCPCAIDVNTRGEIAVADMKLNRVTMFTGSGQALHHFGKSGTNRGEFRGLVDIKFTVLGYVAAVDSENHRIQVLTVTGGVILTIGVRPGWRLGELCLPCAIDIDRNGDFVVCDAGNGRIQRFNGKGKFLAAWGSRRTQSTESSRTPRYDENGFPITTPTLHSIFVHACDVLVGPLGEVFVCDAALGEVFVFSAVGQCLYKFSLPNKDQWRPIAMCMLRDAWMLVSRQVDAVSSVDPFPTDAPTNHQLLLCAHPQRVPNGRFEPWAWSALTLLVSFLSYADALHVRLTNRSFHRACRQLRDEWRLFPLTPGQPSVRAYGRVLQPASGRAAVLETFEKWGLRIFKPANRIRRHVMDFESGFRCAVSSLFGALFFHEHESELRAMFESVASRGSTEIDQSTFLELVTQLEEIRHGFLRWAQCPSLQRSGRIPATEQVAPSREPTAMTRLHFVEQAQARQLDRLLTKLVSL
ncbi:hypothetical protein P43SY_005764 [Pythium insidiosum]|uniref:Major facilitator superfamily (MFS) profile domain-containing protein n=1 Tax=Pythium insidiosum TaxID=114742 RepID=A0AAD5QEY0_PYTIN|nr:hypothetical protein P43SY_005764 [Pythium insidiosum]